MVVFLHDLSRNPRFLGLALERRKELAFQGWMKQSDEKYLS
jgi:hypothetical protein